MTAQVSENLKYDGVHYGLCSEPLASLFSDSFPSPDFVSPHTANWRGYVGSWEIRDNLLYLTELTGIVQRPDGSEQPYHLNDLFPGHPPTGIFAEWCQDALSIPMGKLIHYVHMGFLSQYEHECTLMLWNGRVVLKETVSYAAELPEGDDPDGPFGYGQYHPVIARKRELTPRLEEAFTPEESGFLRAVYAAPEDPIPKLVYADWLQEHHDPRADFIRSEQKRMDDPSPERDAKCLQYHDDHTDKRLWFAIMGFERPRPTESTA